MKNMQDEETVSNLPKVELPHDTFFDELIHREYERVVQSGHTYLDYTGGSLFPKSVLDNHFELLSNNILGNPHSGNPTSQLATKLVDAARQKVLDFFGAEDYYCVFTQNATGALKIVGECYPFTTDSFLLLLADNHNSVNGIREYCGTKGGQFEYCPIHYEDLTIDNEQLQQLLETHPKSTNKLFAFPAQSNVSGVKHDLTWIKKAQDLGWDVLLDAAAYVPTSQLDLKEVSPDFVSISFYKIFGYPTGIGCLLIRKSKFDKLKKPWFAGGTVTLASVQTRHHYLATNHERFENGTINYLGIPAIQMGLEFIESIGIERIHERVTGLAAHLAARLKTIKHDTGIHLVKIFGPPDRTNTGGTLVMNFFDQEGHPYPFEYIEELANKHKISIRSGCFCNPGIDEVNNCLSTEELSSYFTSRDNGDYHDMITFLHKLRGATRVSVGIATRLQDLEVFVELVKSFRNTTCTATV